MKRRCGGRPNISLPLIERSKSRQEIKDATYVRPLPDPASTVMHLTHTQCPSASIIEAFNHYLDLHPNI